MRDAPILDEMNRRPPLNRGHFRARMVLNWHRARVTKPRDCGIQHRPVSVLNCVADMMKRASA